MLVPVHVVTRDPKARMRSACVRLLAGRSHKETTARREPSANHGKPTRGLEPRSPSLRGMSDDGKDG
jgi:hypothetical protein